MTMTLVSTVTVGSGGAASIEFNGVPQTGTDLLITLSARDTYAVTGDNGFTFQFNGNSSGYSSRRLTGTGSSTNSTNSTNAYFFPSSGSPNGSTTSNTFGNVSIYIPNYTSATAKSVSIDAVGENNATAAEQEIYAGLWTGTSAVTSISFGAGYDSFAQYTTASLYTITKGSGGATVS